MGMFIFIFRISWSLRSRGYAYYDAGRWFTNKNPDIQIELWREGIEDYEYLFLANGGKHPRAGNTETIDVTANSAASSLTSWTKDDAALMELRYQLGKIELKKRN